MRSRLVTLSIVAACAACASSVQAQDCAWRPWAASWGTYNLGPDLFPPNGVYDPTNWDFSLSQDTVLDTAKDTPDGSSYALHWFLDAQPPETVSNGSGSGGVYQEITVTAGIPLKYSFHWKAASGSSTTWFEFLLVDGPFTTADADTDATDNIMRKAENADFGWTLIDDQSGLYPGPGGPTITPTGTVVTVILKAGRSPGGAMEAFFDDVKVWQVENPDPVNLLVNGDFEDTGQQPNCDSELMWQDPGQGNYWLKLTECPAEQHTLSAITDPAPAEAPNNSDVVITVSGSFLENATGASLVPVEGGASIEVDSSAFTVGSGPNETSMQIAFPISGARDGVYDLVTAQAPPPCLTQILPAAFTITCPAPTNVTDMQPDMVTDPTGTQDFTLSGDNLDSVTGAELQYEVGVPPAVIIPATVVAPPMVRFNLGCTQGGLQQVPAGSYRLVVTRDDGCREDVLERALTLIKTSPPESCNWQPWSASWSALNLGDDLDPPNEVYNPTNWDYDLSQDTVLGTVKDTADGSANALHWFLDAAPPGESNGAGSGGVYQEIAGVQPGLPLEYSFDWKAAAGDGTSWFELLLIDGPFSLAYADVFQEGDEGMNNLYMVRKTELTSASFGWTTVTHLTTADEGAYGPRPQTITPTGSVVTVVLKAGRYPAGAMESFWDNIVVTQSGGPNLVVNSGFESPLQIETCNAETVFQDFCEFDYWRRADFTIISCSAPFADADGDHDIDQNDFGQWQACYSGTNPYPEPECSCFDRNDSGTIDAIDLAAFEACATGPGITVDPNDPQTWPVGCGD